jgi:hypothetical protein
MIVTYIATRSLIPGHTLGTPYSLEVCLVSADPTIEGRRVDQVALSGRRESLFWHKRDGFAITIGHFSEVSSENDAVLEFLDSTMGGESFTFDMWGVTGDPDDPRTVRTTELYSATRAVQQPGAGTDLITYSFNLEFPVDAS